MAPLSLLTPVSTRPRSGSSPRPPVWRRRVWRRTAAALVGVAALGWVTVGTSAGGNTAGLVLATTTARNHPSASRAPSPAFVRSCFRAGALAGCNQAALADIDRARRAEHLGPLLLPADFFTLSVPRQLGVIADRERGARGLSPFTASPALDRPAQAAAPRGTDPIGPSDTNWTSNFSRGYVTPLAADFAFMYDDGPGSPNLACPSPGASGCWGHRDNILAPWRGTQGAGSYNEQGTRQLTELFVEAA